MNLNELNNLNKKISDKLKKTLYQDAPKKEDNNFNYNFALYNTGLQIKKPSSVFASANLTPIKSAMMPTLTTLEIEKEMDLYDSVIPFLKGEFLIKPNPTMQIVSGCTYQTANWTVDYCEIRGDGTVLYKGIPSKLIWNYSSAPMDGLFLLGELETYSVPESHTKKNYNGNIYYTYDGYDYWIQVEGVRAINILTLADVQPSGSCAGATNYDEYCLTPFEGITSTVLSSTIPTKYYSKILSLGETSVYGTWTLIEERHIESGGGSCFQENTTVEDVTKTLSFSGNERVSFLVWGLKYKKIDGNWVYQGRGNYTVTDTIHTITDMDFEHNGYYAYWSTNTERYMVIGYPTGGGKDGYLNKIELKYLPTMTPYSTINFKRNPEPFPEIKDLTFNDVQAYGTYNPQFKIIGRANPNNEIKKYLINYSQQFIIYAPALNEVIREIPEYDDDYTYTGSTYQLTEGGTNHILKNRYLYYGSFDDVIYEGKIILSNNKYISQVERYI